MRFRYIGHLLPRRLNIILILDIYLLMLFAHALVCLFDACPITTLGSIRLPEIPASQFDKSVYCRRVVINVTRDGELYVYDRRCSDQEVIAALTAAAHAKRSAEDEPEVAWLLADTERNRNFIRLMEAGFRTWPEVLINADARVPFKHVSKILDWCASPGIRLCNISIGARPTRTP